MKSNKVNYFDNFGVEHIPKEVKDFIGNKDIKTNMFRVQVYDSIMRGYFCILLIEFILKRLILQIYLVLMTFKK